jgi:hypothetical protein
MVLSLELNNEVNFSYFFQSFIRVNSNLFAGSSHRVFSRVYSLLGTFRKSPGAPHGLTSAQSIETVAQSYCIQIVRIS